MSLAVPEDLLEIIRGKAERTAGTVALLLVGSAARGYLDNNSDWDFVGIVDDEVPWSRPYRDGGRETFAAPDGRQVELAFSSFARLRRRMAEQFSEGVIATAEYLSEGSVVWVAGSDVRWRELLAEARSMLEGRPDVISPDDLAWRCYDIWNRVKDVEDTLDDPVAGYYLSFLPYWSLVTLYFRLAQRWLPRPKAVFASIEELDPALHGLCAEFASDSSNRTRHSVLRRMMEYMEAKFGIEFERYYTSPPADAESAG